MNVYQVMALVLSSGGSTVPSSSSRQPIGRLASRGLKVLLRMALAVLAGFLVCFYIAASPPMQFLYDIAPPVGEESSSVYVPGMFMISIP
jgi:hypothetical protein